MSYRHEEIKEMIPDYINGLLAEEKKDILETHLSGCSDCDGELELLSDLMVIEADDPGDLFWGTMPRKVMGLYSRGRKVIFPGVSLFRPAPVFLSALILCVAVVLSLLVINGPDTEPDLFFEDPLTSSVLDLNGLSENELPLMIGAWEDESALDEYVFEESETYSYHMDIAFLDQEEFENLYDILENEERKEG
jgi:hypothetical protein